MTLDRPGLAPGRFFVADFSAAAADVIGDFGGTAALCNGAAGLEQLPNRLHP
jgi:hypothetical protein